MKIASVKAFLKEKGKVKEIKSGKVQDIILFIPARKNEFNEPVGKDTYFPVSVFGSDKIKQLEALQIRDKVECDLYLNSYEFVTQKEIGYNLSLSLASIKKI